VERAALRALDSGLIDRVWERLLESDEAQQLVERIAQAPEVRAAIASQGIGLIEDLGRQLGGVSRELDDAIEGVVRRVLRRPQRVERTDRAGLMTRGVALLLDFGLVNLAFIGVSALASLVFGRADGDTGTIVIGTGAWLLVGSVYLTTFWSLAGQTPGMRLLGVRVETNGSRRIGLRRASRRLVGLGLALAPLGLGLAGVVASGDRRGLHDRIAGTEVLYAPRPGWRA
jgi:uncharacterized RDD family membrane protein YckC